MLDKLSKILCVLTLVGGVGSAKAFSLLGAFDTWQTQDLGYPINAELGGPMVIGDEYRRNSPTLVYAFDTSFLEFFGQRGVQEVEKAIKILNDLPPVSEMTPDLSEFPLDSRRMNFQAAALSLLDLKTYALGLLVEQIGLAPADRYVWTVRAHNVQQQTFSVINRNYDPITWEQSAYVNGTLYTYTVAQTYFQPNPADIWEAVEIAVDPFARSVTAVSALLNDGGTIDTRGLTELAAFGFFYTGLTRDDVGGLRYMYRSSNFNNENLPPDAVGGVVSGPSPSSGTGSSGSPWTPAAGSGTPVGGGAGGAAGGGGAVTTNNVATTATRPGIEKIRFVRATDDAVFGLSFSNIVTYTDIFMTNNAVRQQTVSRVIVQPDIVFSAGDIGVAGVTPLLLSRTINLVNNSGLNPNNPGSGAGPGTIDGSSVISLSNIGPFYLHTGNTPQTAGTYGFVWGAFDATTNAPVIFPSGTSIRDLERFVFRGGRSPVSIAQ